MKIFYLFISICILFLSQSCTRSNIKIGDGGLLTKDPCGPPCFWGITPGVSFDEEVVHVLKESKIYDKCHRYDNEIESGARGISCDFIVNFSFQHGKDIVEGIGFQPKDITIERVFSTFGDPDGIIVLVGGTSQEHPPFIAMAILYDQIRTRIILKDQEGSMYIVKPSVLVSDVSYFDTLSYEQIKLDAKQKWVGFGEYQPSNK